MTTTTNEAQITAHPTLPTITITREFESTPDKVFRCWTEQEYAEVWLGPSYSSTRIDHWDCQTGGGYRYASVRDGEEVASFYGSFHEVRPSSRLVQTFTWEGMPDGVALETVTFEELPGGRTLVTMLSLVDSMEGQQAIMSSGMEVGVNDGFAKLDEILSSL
ncbi:MAG TPA: SRPBCC family protein [Nocardioidaceae bacterium]|nr:SRPBCC family protein [Nocardioidaceae bacterium]